MNGRNAQSWGDRFALDLWYVDHWSLRLDLRILARTVWIVARRRGIQAPGSPTMPEFLGRPSTASHQPQPRGHRERAMNSKTPLYIFGAGGHGKVVGEAADAACTHSLRGFLDDDREHWGREIHGVPVRGDLDTLALLEDDAEVALGVGANADRAYLARTVIACGHRLATVVHPTAVLARGARVGPGSYIGPLAVVHADAELGRGVIVNSAAVIEHDVRVADWVHVSPRAALGGGVRVGEGAHVGLGAVVLPGLAIGPWAVLGAGAVLTHSLPARAVAVGVPARWRDTLGRTG